MFWKEPSQAKDPFPLSWGRAQSKRDDCPVRARELSQPLSQRACLCMKKPKITTGLDWQTTEVPQPVSEPPCPWPPGRGDACPLSCPVGAGTAEAAECHSSDGMSHRNCIQRHSGPTGPPLGKRLPARTGTSHRGVGSACRRSPGETRVPQTGNGSAPRRPPFPRDVALPKWQ